MSVSAGKVQNTSFRMFSWRFSSVQGLPQHIFSNIMSCK